MNDSESYPDEMRYLLINESHPLASNLAMGRWERPWPDRPPAGTWAFTLVTCPARDRVTECAVEDVVDALRGMVDTGLLRPDDVVRDIVLLNGRWRVRLWRHA